MKWLLNALLPLLTLSTQPLLANELATFAGGCFWCVEEAFDKVPGVITTTSGFANGRIENPTYDQVSAGGTGYTEAVQVEFDQARVSYAQLLQTFCATTIRWMAVGSFATEAINIARASSITPRRNDSRRKPRWRSYANRHPSREPSLPQSCHCKISMRPSAIIRTTTLKIQFATNSTSTIAAGRDPACVDGRRRLRRRRLTARRDLRRGRGVPGAVRRTG